MTDFLIFQLVDSMLPIGSFAHSLGLESAHKNGLIQCMGLEKTIKDILDNSAALDLHFLKAAYETEIESIDTLIHEYDIRLTNDITRRASLVQGKALLSLLPKLNSSVDSLNLDQKELETLPFFVIIFGLVTKILSIPLEKAISMFLFTMSRDLVSAAIRLSLIGPIESVKFQNNLQDHLNKLSLNVSSDITEAHMKSPLYDVIQGMHDQLKYRLFNS